MVQGVNTDMITCDDVGFHQVILKDDDDKDMAETVGMSDREGTNCGIGDDGSEAMVTGSRSMKTNIAYPGLSEVGIQDSQLSGRCVADFNASMLDIYNRVFHSGMYNYQDQQIPIPSGLNIAAWEIYLQEYTDKEIIKFLQFGWPSNFEHSACLQSTFKNHQSGVEYASHIDSYLDVERGKSAILGPFSAPPIVPIHISPIMTRPKKDSLVRRVVVDLSWPRGMSINDGIPSNEYLGRSINLTLPTVDYMAERVQSLGRGCFMYKLDLSRGYRQLRLDPLDWPLMSIRHDGQYYMDMCPPFGLRTAALMMQRTTTAASYIHGLFGYLSRPYIDDFGGAEMDFSCADKAMNTLHSVLDTVGLEVAEHKTCTPSNVMIWLGILIDSENMTKSIPDTKLLEIKTFVKSWENKVYATRREVQSLMGMLNFVSGVSYSVRVYTNRVLNFLRTMDKDGLYKIPSEVRDDLDFFQILMPDFNGVTLLAKELVPSSDQLEIDACLTGCGGLCGSQYYSREFPKFVLSENHPIAHLEILNAVVATRLWAPIWRGCKLQLYCDNMNACLALQNGRCRDLFLQSCVRAIFLLTAQYDIDLLVCHSPGVSLQAADALSRLHKDSSYRDLLIKMGCLNNRYELEVPDEMFEITD